MTAESRTQIITDAYVRTWGRSEMERKIKKYAHYVGEIRRDTKEDIHRNLLLVSREIGEVRKKKFRGICLFLKEKPLGIYKAIN